MASMMTDHEREQLLADYIQAALDTNEAIREAEVLVGIRLEGHQYGSFEQRIARIAEQVVAARS